MLAEQTEAEALLVIEACNPLAHFLSRFLTKLSLGIRLRLHLI
jgi:hypothetical protein